jgi:alkanesulfonate monooxygenase SsuD/methylene tetrahydromethanopterin reductase-like flavin-dependent oxidoreductase (luciferase family)
MDRNAMKFGAHYLPTYVPDLDGPINEFYRRMFSQMEEMDRLGYDHIWVTEHHFAMYGGTLPHPPTFMSAIARTTQRIRLGVAINVLPLHNPLDVAESYAMVDVISNGRLDFGVGKGSEAHEYRKLGVPQEESTGRMYEGVEIIRARLGRTSRSISKESSSIMRTSLWYQSLCSVPILPSGWVARAAKKAFAGLAKMDFI